MSDRAALLHASPWQGVFYVTGGGSPLITELLTTAGASATVLEVRVPYAHAALTELLGRAPEQACSAATARALAMAAFQRARALQNAEAAAGNQPAEHQPFGLACTASLATNRTKRGGHRAHVALQTETTTYDAELAFDGDRETEERELLELLWHALAQTLELPLPAGLDRPPAIARTPARPPWRDLVVGDSQVHATGGHDGRLLLPGAFNPLHHAHERMLDIAEARLGLSGAFELSILNVDKPPLDYTEIDRRLQQFRKPVWLTRLPTFLDKARHFRGAWFALGVDTLTRLLEPRYYGSAWARDAALEEIVALGTRFIVFGRTLDGRFQTLDDLELPAAIERLCLGLPADVFQEPVSSTGLRQGR